jgi:hypothetical protein
VQQTRQFSACGNTTCSPKFPDSSCLVLSGHLFDTIAELSDLSRIEDPEAFDHLVEDDDEPAESADPNPATNDAKSYSALTQVNEDAQDPDDLPTEQDEVTKPEDEAATKPEEDTSITEDFKEVADSLRGAFRTFSRIYTALSDFTLHLAVYIAWERLALHPKTRAPFTTSTPADAYMRTLVADQIPASDAAALAAITDEFRVWTRSLSALRTMARLRVDALPRAFRPLGFLAHVRATWDAYPAFAERIGATRARRMARSGVGCLCLLPAAARAGDEIWLARGGRVPLVLRPKEGGRWELVGEAYVHGIMYGAGFREEDCIDICIE